MVWLNAEDVNGNGLYLHIHRMEQRVAGQGIFALHGTVGDGYYEGEVLLEVGEDVEITFADQWLDRFSLESFFERTDRQKVESALARTVSSMTFCVDNFPSFQNRPRKEIVAYRSEGRNYPVRPLGGEEQLELPMVGEGEILWRVA